MEPSIDNSMYASMVTAYKEMSGKEAIENRLGGLLPIIDIAGHPFIIDVKGEKLNPKGIYGSNGLDTRHGGWQDKQSGQHCFYYNVHTKSEYQISPDITKLPEGVVQIRIPDPYTLDPIGMANKEKVAPTAYLDKHPMIMYHKAAIIPLAETVVMDIVDLNNQKKKRFDAYQPKKIKPNKKNSRGI